MNKTFPSEKKKKKKDKRATKKKPIPVASENYLLEGVGAEFLFRLFKVMWAMSSVSFDIL